MSKIHEVAALVGVSTSTVSRVFNNPEIVSPETRNRVLEISRKLNYYPSSIGRNLVSGKTGLIGLIIPDITNPYFSNVARGCSSVLSDKNLTLTLYDTEEQTKNEKDIRKLIYEKGADGLIVSSESLELSENTDDFPRIDILPTVYIERINDKANIDSVLVDNEQISYIAVDFLTSLGHKKIAVVTGPQHTYTGKMRLKGFLERMDKKGLTVPENYVISGNFKLQDGIIAAEQIVDMSDPPSAVYICNDLMAYSAMSRFDDFNWNVPNDISIIGCGDYPLSAFYLPKLSTIHIPSYTLGQIASKLLLRRIKSPKIKSKTEVVSGRLVIGKTARQIN